jgi:hypothetical protein
MLKINEFVANEWNGLALHFGYIYTYHSLLEIVQVYDYGRQSGRFISLTIYLINTTLLEPDMWLVYIKISAKIRPYSTDIKFYMHNIVLKKE